jgi:acetyltransferase-like isoleucine patch superfamily enzyme
VHVVRDSLVSLVARSRRTPWKAATELKRFAVLPVARAYFAWHGIEWRLGWRVYGLPVIQRYRPSRITIGEGLEMRNWFASNPIGITRPCILATWGSNAVIEIGERTGMSGVTICAQERIAIGRRVVLGANSVIIDTDFHGLEAGCRLEPGASAPVVIEDDVFVGMHALILKGSRIGRGSVIGAGSVVTGEIPAGVIAAGNPARVIRKVEHVGDVPRSAR